MELVTQLRASQLHDHPRTQGPGRNPNDVSRIFVIFANVRYVGSNFLGSGLFPF